MTFCFFPLVLAQEIFSKWVSKDELSPFWEADRRELCHLWSRTLAKRRAVWRVSVLLRHDRHPVRVPENQDCLLENWDALFFLKSGCHLCLLHGSQVSTGHPAARLGASGCQASTEPGAQVTEGSSGHCLSDELWPPRRSLGSAFCFCL